MLKYGSLPLSFESSEAETVSATLGLTSLRAGLWAGLIGLGLVLLYSLAYYRVLGILTGRRGLLKPPVEHFMAQLHPQEQAAIADFLAAAVIGGPETVRAGFQTLVEATGADEIMMVCDVYDPALRLRSLDIAAAALSEAESAVA